MMCNFSFINIKWSSTIGLVKISASWFSVSMKVYSSSFLFTWSRKKWCFISICLDRECWMGFLDKFIALLLSHKIWIFVYLNEKSSSWFLIHNTWEHQLATETYSTSVVNKAMVFCFLHDQLTSAFPKSWQCSRGIFSFCFITSIVNITVG